MALTPARSPHLARAVAVLLAGGAAAQLLPLLLGPVLARLYSPAAMGLYTAFAAWAATLAVAACGRYDFALPLARDEAEAEGLLALCVRIGIGVSLSMVLLSIVWIVLWPDTSHLVAWLAPLVALMAWVQLRVMWATRAQAFQAMALSRFVQYGAVALLQVAVAWGAMGAPGLHAAWGGPLPAEQAWLLVASQAVALGLAAWVLRRPAPRRGWLRAAWPPADAPGLRELARRHRDFPLLNAPHALLGALQDALAVALILAFTGDVAAGFWGLALRYLKAPAALVGQAVSQAVYPRLAQTSVAEGRRLVRRLLALLAALGVLGAALLMLVGPALFAWAFGEPWRPAGELARALAPYIAVHFVAAPLAVVTMAWQAQAWAFKLALVGQAVFLLALALGLWQGGLQGAAWAVSLAMLPYFGWYFWRLANWPLAPKGREAA
ncbi:hypothetical protein CCO03_07810 [Comamonas serinivorans]|uniref:Polysaccharide biosynthesis protein n=1 Tax=Comamonas serinivorans TaxID=1082851 RepID=A0A1Y0EMF7_9BURK|nr:hypothetical protein [Comamonas serinivorans]ARU04590.1 hypothetical protein CCO03_07810 [Comamonas serinivorans]